MSPEPLAVLTPEAQPEERAERRARGQVRRYAVANGCSRLLTLTNRDQTHDPQEVRRRFHQFARRLSRAYPSVAWVRTLERHQSGAVHVHVALSRFIPKERLAALWGHGFVDVRKLRSSRPGGREAARLAARYVSKYVTKESIADPGQHRYEVRQGCQPEAVAIAGWDHEEARRAAIGLMWGEVPAYEWSSSGDPDWLGPPVTFHSW